jgi:hypothetical protein
MASPPRTREEERRLNARTLVIASAASASSAAVTSQLWIAGTWIAAAVTPLIVALVSELLHRPTERIARAITSDSPALRLDDSEEAPASEPHLDPDAPGPAPVRVYRQPAAPTSRRRIALRVVLITALLGLLIGGATLTAAELIAGQSIGKGDSATSLGGGKARNKRTSTTEERSPAAETDDTTTEKAPATEPTEPRTVTVTVPTETTTAPTATTPAAPDTTP